MKTQVKRSPPIKADRPHGRDRHDENAVRQEVNVERLGKEYQRCGGGFRVLRKQIGGA